MYFIQEVKFVTSLLLLQKVVTDCIGGGRKRLHGCSWRTLELGLSPAMNTEHPRCLAVNTRGRLVEITQC